MRKILSLFVASLFCATMFADKTVYLKLSSDWAGWPAKYAVHYFKSANNSDNGWSDFMSVVANEENVYTTTIPENYNMVIFVRFNSAKEATGDWKDKYSQTVNLVLSTEENPLFTVTSGGTGDECNGTWSVYEPIKFFISGNTALLNDAGSSAAEWAPTAITSRSDTYELNLQAEKDYKLALTTDGTWDTKKGYSNLEVKSDSLKWDGDNNVCFRLHTPGIVRVIYTGSAFNIEADFEFPAIFYITGDSALVVDAGKDKAKAWAPTAIKSTKNSYEIQNLKANQDYKLKVTVDGTWGTSKGFSDLTDTVGGLYPDNDKNICFRLAAAGNVTVAYNGSKITLSGNFARPTVGIVGDFEGNKTWALQSDYTMTAALDRKSAYVTFTIDDVKDYEMKVSVDGNFLSLNGGGETQFLIYRDSKKAAHVNLVNGGGRNFLFRPDVPGDYTFTWHYADSTLTVDFPEKVAIVGEFNSWNPATHCMTFATDSSVSVTVESLAVGTYEMKVWDSGLYYTQYGAEGLYRVWRNWQKAEHVNVIVNENNLQLEADVAGNYVFEWVPATKNLYVTFPPTTPTAIDNTDANAMAVKRIVNGQLFIIREGKTFNALGVEVK